MANKEFVRILKSAKNILREDYAYSYGKEKFICFAIFSTDGWYKDTNKLTEIIDERLGSYNTLEEWLVKNKHLTRHQLRSKKTKNLIQQHRHAWVDELIREFS